MHLFIWIGAFLFLRFIPKLSHLSTKAYEISISLCVSVAIVRIFKVVIGRARPSLYLSKGGYGFHFFSFDPHFHAFPSTHTIIAFTLAMALSLLYPRFRYYLLTAATLLALSRIFLLDHYFSDVIGSACIGVIVAKGVHYVLQKIIRDQSARI